MNSRVLFAVCVALGAMLATSPAFAEDALKKAQSSFDTAQSDYLQGKFDEAAAGFQEAYAARPFPQFLYNVGASFHMKGKKTSDVVAYGKAVEFYKRYLTEEPNAGDKPKVEKAIGVLEAEIARLKAGAGAGSGSGSATPVQTPSQEVQNLGDVKVRGLVVIVTEPQNATIYLDDKKKGPFATTPWSGSIEGEHKLIIE
jgi:tetratricopeptide (TPR) repeat protein